MAEATDAAASAALDAQTPTPIAQLSPELPDRDSRVIDGVVTITWPYSIVTRSAAFILAEHDFRLRHARGQLRLEFHGPVGQKLADAAIGGGDSLRISLQGAQWEAHKSQTRVPGTILEWQLKFTDRLLMRILRAEDQKTEVLDLTLPFDATADAPLATLTQDSSPLLEPGTFLSEAVSTPGAHSPNFSMPAKRPISSLEPTEFASPAFLKRARVSYGSLFEGGFDIFDEDVSRKKKKTAKRSRFSMGGAGWKYSSRSPSPEPEQPEAHELESDGDASEAEEEVITKAIKSPVMVDEASQTQDASFAVQIAEQAQASAALLPSSPTPISFGQPEDKANGHKPPFGTTAAEAPKQPVFGQPQASPFGTGSNTFAPATTTPSRNVFGSSFGNSGFSVEHTTTASSSSIPVFNDSLAESLQNSFQASGNSGSAPEQSEWTTDAPAPMSFESNSPVGQEGTNEANEFAIPSFPMQEPRNPFAVEPYPEAALAGDKPEEDIYGAAAYPSIPNDEPLATDASMEEREEAASQPGELIASQVDADESGDDESTDYEIEAREPQRLLPRESEEDASEDEEDDEDQEGHESDEGEDGEDGYGEEGYGERDAGVYNNASPDYHDQYDEDEEHYSEGEEEEEEEEEEEGYDEDEEEEAAAPRNQSAAHTAAESAVVISLLSDSEDDEPAPAPAVKTEPAISRPSQQESEEEDASGDEEEQGEDDEAEEEEEEEEDDDDDDEEDEEVEGVGEEDSVAEELDSEEEAEAVAEGEEKDNDDKEEDEGEVLIESSPAPQTSNEQETRSSIHEADHPAEVEDAATVDATPDDQPEEEADTNEKQPSEGGKIAESAPVASEETVNDDVDKEALVDEMDVDEDEDEVSLVPFVEPERSLGDVSKEGSPIEVDEVKQDDPMEEDVTPPPRIEAVEAEAIIEDDDDVEVTEAPVEIGDEIKSQPDVDMNSVEPEFRPVKEDTPEVVSAETVVQKETETLAEPAAEATEDATEAAQPVEPTREPTVDEESVPPDAKQLEIEAAEHPPKKNLQLPTPINTQIPATEVSDIQIVKDQQEPYVDEDEFEANQQLMGEFLEHTPAKQHVPPPPSASPKEHRRKRSDTMSETGRRTRSQTKHTHDDDHDAAVEASLPRSSPRSHRRSSRSIDKTSDATVAASIETVPAPAPAPAPSKSDDKTPLLQRSFRITRSRGAADNTDPSVAIAKVAAPSASPKSPEHTPSRPIMLRVTRSMENIAEAGLKEGLVIPEASVRSTRLDDASSSGTRSPAGTPLTPSTQLQLQTQQDQRYAQRPSESPASAGLKSPSIAESLPDTDGVAAPASASELKMQLQRDLRTTLPDNLALKSLRTSLNKTADMIAVAVATPADPYRPKNGPRDFMLELLLADPSSAPSGVHVAHLFRPHRNSLPTVQAGDVVLLRGMTVVAVKDRGFGLRVGDASAWAVFDEQARRAGGDGGGGHDVPLPQIKGPPVEVMEAEVQYAMGLRRWWDALDEGARGKLERAAQRMLALS